MQATAAPTDFTQAAWPALSMGHHLVAATAALNARKGEDSTPGIACWVGFFSHFGLKKRMNTQCA
jgi:hypothetical protein